MVVRLNVKIRITHSRRAIIYKVRFLLDCLGVRIYAHIPRTIILFCNITHSGLLNYTQPFTTSHLKILGNAIRSLLDQLLCAKCFHHGATVSKWQPPCLLVNLAA